MIALVNAVHKPTLASRVDFIRLPQFVSFADFFTKNLPTVDLTLKYGLLIPLPYGAAWKTRKGKA